MRIRRRINMTTGFSSSFGPAHSRAAETNLERDGVAGLQPGVDVRVDVVTG
jgi:hypothetical protein